ncbi:MAG TPA: hypothetical protein VF980_05545 [Thermoanaerobaculia bacterium]
MQPDLEQFLRRVMRDGEHSLRTFVACSPSSVLERAILGSGIQHLRRCIVAITTERLIQIAVHRDLSPRGALSQIWWGDVKSFRVSMIRRTLVLTFRSGRTQRFTDLAFGDAQAIHDLIAPLAGRGQTTVNKGRESLCALCMTQLRPGSPACPNCHAPMRRRGHAIKLAWWSAGGGYHYLGFPHLAVLAGMIEIGFYAVFAFAIVAALQRHGLMGAIVAVCTTVLFVEWKAAVISHTASLANEATLDLRPRHDGDETLVEILEDAMQWMVK